MVMLWLNIILIIVSIALTVLILLQARSAGLGAALGGSAGMYVRRGGEKRIFQATIFFSLAFILIAFAHLFIR